MIKDTDILKAVSKILKTKFKYKVFEGENLQEVKVPSFFISINPLTSDTFKEYEEKMKNVYITYTNKGVLMEELLDIGEELNKLFEMSLKVNDLAIPLRSKKKFNRQDDFITMTIPLDFKDSKDNAQATTDLMGNLNLKLSRKEW